MSSTGGGSSLASSASSLEQAAAAGARLSNRTGTEQSLAQRLALELQISVVVQAHDLGVRDSLLVVVKMAGGSRA